MKKGTNVIAGHVISGSAGFVLVVGGHDDLCRFMQLGRGFAFKPPPGRAYLEDKLNQ